jgi:hypothetical protein
MNLDLAMQGLVNLRVMSTKPDGGEPEFGHGFCSAWLPRARESVRVCGRECCARRHLCSRAGEPPFWNLYYQNVA